MLFWMIVLLIIFVILWIQTAKRCRTLAGRLPQILACLQMGNCWKQDISSKRGKEYWFDTLTGRD